MGRRIDALDAITKAYLGSRDFNGLPIDQLSRRMKSSDEITRKTVAGLIKNGLVCAVFGDTHPNPHVHAFPDKPRAQQIRQLREGAFCCLYPTPKCLRQVVNVADFADRPFTLRLKLGEPELTPVSVGLSVLELYRNDPRYYYTHGDIWGTICIADKFYGSKQVRKGDKVLIQSFGFSFNRRMDRAVAAFLIDLAKLTPEHQLLWKSQILGPSYRIHPDFYRNCILGEWGERISVFDAFLEELRVINAMSAAMGRPHLFRDDFHERPRRFTWILRPTIHEFNDFVLLLDNMMSDNLNKDFFRGQVELETDVKRKDGKVVAQPKGTIVLLEEFLSTRVRMKHPKPLKLALATFRHVRALRQKPAHAVLPDEFDKKIVTRHRRLVFDAYTAIRTIRLVFANHPHARTCEMSDALREGKIWPF